MPFNISIPNFSFLLEWASLPFPLLLWQIFKSGGWVLFLYAFWRGGKDIWLNWRQNKWGAKQKFVLLAIDVPKDNEQTPKAVENIFTTLAGAHGSETFWEIWWEGKFQQHFSLELISIDGYIQFLIWTNVKFRDLVESAIYAQYPGAEIVEVADYVDNVPINYPDPEWELWAAEYKLHKEEAYPIKTWEEFEHRAAEEGVYKDTMAVMLEGLSNLLVGEQVWLQLLVVPIDDKWRAAGEKLVKKLIGAPVEVKRGMLETIILGPISFIGDIATGLFFPPVEKKPTREAPPSKIIYLSPGEVEVVKGIQKKIGKLGFKCKIRLMYVARKELYNKAKAVGTAIGGIKQFNTLNMNNFRPDKRTWTVAHYAFAKMRLAWRQKKILRYYKGRSHYRGGKTYVLNIEELASVWHFPAKEIRMPLLKTTTGKKAEAPVGLPIEALPPGLAVEARPAAEAEGFATGAAGVEKIPMAPLAGAPAVRPAAAPIRLPVPGLPDEQTAPPSARRSLGQPARPPVAKPPTNLPTG